MIISFAWWRPGHMIQRYIKLHERSLSYTGPIPDLYILIHRCSYSSFTKHSSFLYILFPRLWTFVSKCSWATGFQNVFPIFFWTLAACSLIFSPILVIGNFLTNSVFWFVKPPNTDLWIRDKETKRHQNSRDQLVFCLHITDIA